MSNLVFYNPQDVMAEWDTYYAEGYRAFGQLYPIMASDLRFYLGDQWTLEEQQYLREQNRHYYVYNYTRSKINWILGYLIQNRLSSVCVPAKGGAQEVADIYSDLLLNIFSQNNGYGAFTETCGAALKTGWSLCNVFLDFNSDPYNGDFGFAKDPYSAFICDPYFTKLDMSDCNWVQKRKYLSPEQALTLLPGQEDEVRALAHDGWERDNKFTWMVFQRVPTGQRMMAYNEFYRLKYEPQRVLVNKETGQFTDWAGDADTYQYLKSLADRQGANLDIMYRRKQFVEKHIILNNTYMRTEINPYGLNEYPFQLIAPVFEPESEDYTYKVQSLVRILRDPQREMNRRRNQIIDFVESQLNTGWIEEDGAVKNPQMLYQTGQGKRIVLNEGYKINQIAPIEPRSIPQGFFAEFQQTEKDMIALLGLNDAAMGTQDSKQVSALVELHRQAAALIPLQDVFDRIRDAQKNISRKILKMVQNWTPEKIKAITGKDVPDEFYDKDLLKYDIVVQEGILTDTQKYMYFRQLIDLKQLGEPIPPGKLTEEAPLQNKSDLVKSVQAYQKQLDQQQQMLAQSEQKQVQSLSESLQARAIADLSRSKEYNTRAVANLGLEDERVAKAQQDRDMGLLDKIKAIGELEKLDTAHRADKDKRLLDMLNFFMMYEDRIAQRESLEKQQNALQAQQSGGATPAAPTGPVTPGS